MKRVAPLLLAVCTLSSVVYSQAVAFDYSKLYDANHRRA